MTLAWSGRPTYRRPITMSLLEVDALHIHFGNTPVVTDVSLRLDAGRTLCLVGESGCGKSVTALSLARLLPVPPARYAGGSIRVDGVDVLAASPDQLRSLRGGTMSYVFQEPGNSLNPTHRVGQQILESLKLHRPDRARENEVVRLLARVGIASPAERARDYPHQLSGGMQQRVMIAMALASEPRLLIADEPTTALDVTIQAQILELLRDIQRQEAMGILLITHNLALVADFADDLAVMYAGEIVEEGPAKEVLAHPRHPYTRALIASVPAPGRTSSRLKGIPGSVPLPGRWSTGCRFADRCEQVQDACRAAHPNWTSRTESGRVRCPYGAGDGAASP